MQEKKTLLYKDSPVVKAFLKKSFHTKQSVKFTKIQVAIESVLNRENFIQDKEKILKPHELSKQKLTIYVAFKIWKILVDRRECGRVFHK